MPSSDSIIAKSDEIGSNGLRYEREAAELSSVGFLKKRITYDLSGADHIQTPAGQVILSAAAGTN